MGCPKPGDLTDEQHYYSGKAIEADSLRRLEEEQSVPRIRVIRGKVPIQNLIEECGRIDDRVLKLLQEKVRRPVVKLTPISVGADLAETMKKAHG